MEFNFPDGFLWGVATAGHQIEGQNTHSDWWDFEHQHDGLCAESSGDACDFYHRYQQDIEFMRELGLRAFRFSLEWARIEPAEGEFSNAALAHYRRVTQSCLDAGLEPVVTFNHATLPSWCQPHGGWLWEEIPERYARYCERAATTLSDLLGYVITINEPDLVANLGYRFGMFPGPHSPGAGGPGEEAAKRAGEHLTRAHHRAREVIRQAAPEAKVGISVASTEWGCAPGYEQQLADFQRMWEGPFYEIVAEDDFIGAMPYTRVIVGPMADDPLPGLPPIFNMYPPGTRRSAMGYEFRPEALEGGIRRTYEQTGLPILVVENGVPTDDDRERVEYIERALPGLANCLRDGIDVRGYLHWSLLDNFEWNLGFRMHFGLVAVDLETFERKPKPSAYLLGEYAKANRLELADEDL